MRNVRITCKKGLFLGGGHHPRGTIVSVPDDRRASQLVALGHAELVTPVGVQDAHLQPVEKATAPAGPERAARR